MSSALISQQRLIPEYGVDFRQCHASTLVVLPEGDLLVAWFAGQKEGSGDTAIWLARREKGRWHSPQRTVACDGLAHWNPVLFNAPDGLWLFYKVGSGVHVWKTRYVKSTDGGVSWSEPAELVNGDALPRGPVKNKILLAADGTWIAPGSIEDDRHWDAFVDCSDDNGKSWHFSPVPLEHYDNASARYSHLWQGLKDEALWENDLSRVLRWDGVIQPSLWESSPGHIHMLMRSTRGWLYRSDSVDNGKTWCAAYATALPNNNSGIDLVMADGNKLVLVCNPVSGNWGQRFPLSLSVSGDNGESWSSSLDLESEEGEFSYPAIVSEGNTLHLTYTWNRQNIIYCELQLA